MMDDTFMYIALLVLVGIGLGFLPALALAMLTLLAGLVVVLFLRQGLRSAPPGTIAGIGLFVMFVGGWFCVFLPAWITYAIR